MSRLRFRRARGSAPPSGVAPSITTHPQGGSIAGGGTHNMSVVATGTAPLAYQWKRNLTAIAGAIAAAYGATIAGSYAVDVSNAYGSTTSNAAIVSSGVDWLSSMPAGIVMGTDGRWASWDPVAFADMVHAGAEFTAFADAGEGATAPLDANGFPSTTSWAIKPIQNAGRANPQICPQGVWKGRAVWTSTIGVIDLAYGGATISNVVTVGQVTTFDLTVSGSEFTLVFRGTQGVTNFQVIAPGEDTVNPPIFHAQARAFLIKMHTFRTLNLMLMNNAYAADWAAENIYPQKGHGKKGWGWLCRAFTELFNAPGSNMKCLVTNSFPTWVQADIQSFIQYVKDNIPAGANTQFAPANEWWNFGTFWHPHWLLAYVNQQATITTHGLTNFPVRAIPTVDHTRVWSGTSDQYTAFKRAWALYTARLAVAAKNVYGADFGVKCMVVLEGQLFNISWTSEPLAWLAESAQVAEFGAPNTYIHGVGAATYLGIPAATVMALDVGADPLTAMFNELRTGPEGLSAVVAKLADYRALQLQYGIRHHVLYEVNPEHLDYVPHPNPPPQFYLVTNLPALCRDSRFAMLMADLIAAQEAAGVRLAHLYWAIPTTFSVDHTNSCWGFTERWDWDYSPRSAAVKAYLTSKGMW